MKMIFLINEENLKSYSLIGDNVDTKYILNALQIAQDVKLQDILGSRLYKKLLYLVEADLFNRGTYIECGEYCIVNSVPNMPSVGDIVLLSGAVVGEVVNVEPNTPIRPTRLTVTMSMKNGDEAVETINAYSEEYSINVKEYKLLLDDYIHNYLIYQTMSEIQMMLYAKYRNAGMISSVDQQMMSIDLKDISYLQDYYQNLADFYGNRMTDYLHVNKSKYPEYCHCNCNGEIGANCQSYNCNIVL